MSSLESDLLSCLDLIRDFDVVGLKVLVSAFMKINSGFGFNLRSFRMPCSLGMRYFVGIWLISVLNIGQFHEKTWWSAPQWQHLISILGHLPLLFSWLLHLAYVAIVSWHLSQYS